jgi:hypothetical protein
MTQDNIAHSLFSVCDIGENANGQVLRYDVTGTKTNPGILAHNRKHAVVEPLIDAAAISLSVVECTVRAQVCFREFFGKDSTGKQAVPKRA